MATGGIGVMDDQLNVPLEDAELLAEVELTTNLIIAASEADAALPQDEVDRLLGPRGRARRPARHPGPAHPQRSEPAAQLPRARLGVNPRSRREFPTTHTLDAAIAAPAIIGLSRPRAATGIPTTL